MKRIPLGTRYRCGHCRRIRDLALTPVVLVFQAGAERSKRLCQECLDADASLLERDAPTCVILESPSGVGPKQFRLLDGLSGGFVPMGERTGGIAEVV